MTQLLLLPPCLKVISSNGISVHMHSSVLQELLQYMGDIKSSNSLVRVSLCLYKITKNYYFKAEEPKSEKMSKSGAWYDSILTLYTYIYMKRYTKREPHLVTMVTPGNGWDCDGYDVEGRKGDKGWFFFFTFKHKCLKNEVLTRSTVTFVIEGKTKLECHCLSSK